MMNIALYNLLHKVFGVRPNVHNKGQQIVFVEQNGKGKLLHPGEQYSVPCPFCGDRKRHLWISYIWGQKVYDTYLYPARCYRRDCLNNPVFRKELKKLLSSAGTYKITKFNTEAYLPSDIEEDAETREASLQIYRNAESLASLDWEHPAIKYVLSRNFDPFILSRKYEARVCLQLEHPIAFGRILFPIYSIQQELIGWVGRTYLGKEPRYYNSRTKINKSFFNLLNALKYNTDFVIVTEGIFDCIRVETLLHVPVIASLGKSLSPFQKDLLSLWKTRFILFDSDAYNDAKRLAQELQSIAVRCPNHLKDPGDACSHSDFADLLRIIKYVHSKESQNLRENVHT